MRHRRVDRSLRGHVVPEGELRGTRRRNGQRGVMSEALARPERELEPRLEVEEGDGTVLELGADDALGPESQAVVVEAQRSLEVVDAEGDERDPGLHARSR